MDSARADAPTPYQPNRGEPKIHRANRNTIVIVSLAALLLIIGCAVVGGWSAREMRLVVTRDFNEEQLTIARGIANWIKREINFLEKEIGLLSRDLSELPAEPATLQPAIQKTFTRTLESGVWKIEIFDLNHNQTYAYMPSHHWAAKQTADPGGNGFPPHSEPSPPRVWISSPQIKASGINLLLNTALPGNPSVRVQFYVNTSWFLNPFIRDIRSGKTGYAWIIDQQGTFLFHPKSDFIGESAFEVRKREYPGIPYGNIDFIQKEEMLAGYEGTGWYFSGWHRGVSGKVKKLIAYCPVTISENPPQTWSVAVVAPVSEVEAALRKGQVRLYLLGGLVVLVILAGAGTITWLEIRWSSILEMRVRERTQAFEKSEEKYRSLVESAEDFIFTVNSEGTFQSMNSFTANFFGGRTEDFLGKDMSALFPVEAARRQLSLVNLVCRYGKSVRDEFEMTIGAHKNWISANFMPLKDEKGAVISVLCIARDITENKVLERQLINTEKLASMGTLAAGVAHEINNPLGVILGFCDILLRKSEQDSQEFEDLKTIERQGLLCKQVVENLLSFARVREGATECADVNRCLEEIIKVVNHTLEMNDIDLALSLSKNLSLVKGDPRQLQQVFLNLITNAVAAMPDGGRLALRTFPEKYTRKVVVQFEDNGEGIKEEDMDHIFEPFFTTKPEGEGTGLGLFVSYGIINKFGGVIDCANHNGGSPGRSRGAVFTIKLLPCAVNPGEPDLAAR